MRASSSSKSFTAGSVASKATRDALFLDRFRAVDLPYADIAIAVLVGVAVAAYLSTRWRDDPTLYAHSVAACPASAHNHYRYAGLLESRGEFDEAAWHVALAYEAIRRFPDEWEHPAIEAEGALPAEERVRRLHALLRVDRPEFDWRNAVAGYALHNGMPRAAARIMAWAQAPTRRCQGRVAKYASLSAGGARRTGPSIRTWRCRWSQCSTSAARG